MKVSLQRILILQFADMGRWLFFGEGSWGFFFVFVVVVLIGNDASLLCTLEKPDSEALGIWDHPSVCPVFNTSANLLFFPLPSWFLFLYFRQCLTV